MDKNRFHEVPRAIAYAAFVALVLMLWMMLGASASSQEVAVVPVETDIVTQAWAVVAAVVALVVSVIVAAAKWVGVVLSADRVAMLHSAIMSYARAAVARGATREEAWGGLGAYLESSIPDTVKRLRQIAAEVQRVFGGPIAEAPPAAAAPVLSVLYDGKFELAKSEAAGAAFVTLEGEINSTDVPLR